MENQTLEEQIYEANIAAHRIESKYFELLHPEIYNKIEQRRLVKELKKAVRLVASGGRRALDFGAGTGNVTGKLLRMGYEVTSVDISREMCGRLQDKYADFVKNGMLHIVNSKIEDAYFGLEEFDLITCYSVLHHLPDYEQVIQMLASYLKKGGILYLDHEISPFVGSEDRIARTYYRIDWVVNSLIGTMIPQIRKANDERGILNRAISTLADYWGQPERKIDNARIKRVFKELSFTYSVRKDYHLHRTRIPNPVYFVFKYASRPDVSCWIAHK
ncbi:MAG: class I SAM-dependent methyltransferase [Candidatus Bathyarchaeia archaeon]